MLKETFVYLVEDSIDDAVLAAALLQRAGVGRVEYTASGRKAGEEIAALDQLPDLILVDKNLRGIRGAEVINMLGRRPETQNIPALLVTGDDRHGSPEVDLYKEDYINKRWLKAQILQALSS